MSNEINNIYRFDEFELNAGRRTLTRAGEKIPLAPKTFEVLLYLVANAGRVILKQDLLAAVWPESFVEESNLTQHIFWLRKALGPNSTSIVTIPGRGYQFTAQVQTVADDELAQQTQGQSPAPDAPATTAPSPLRRPTYWAIAAIAVILATLAGWGGWHRLHGAIPGDYHEVVLADFDNTTGDPDFDRTLKTLLVIDLNQSPYLIVATDNDVKKILKLMNAPADGLLTPTLAREVCERLNDQVILTGLIARIGQKYLVTLSATDCSDGKNLVQTKAVASDRGGVIKAVDSVAADMRERLGEPLKTLRRSGQPLVRAHTFSLDALKAYSQARALHVKLKFADAVPLYKRAIELDPNFADAWAQLGNCYNNMGEALLGRTSMAKAYELRDQADEPARLRITAMYEYWKTGDRHAAIRNYQNWASLYPNQTNPWVLLGEFQESVGRLDLAVDALQHAVSLKPDSADANTSLAEVQLYDGRLEDAKATCRKALGLGLDLADLHHTLLNIAYFQHDTALFQEQMAWFQTKGSADDRESAQAEVDSSQGKIHSAVAHWLHVADQQKANGLDEAAQEGFSGVPRLEAELGLTADARLHLKRYEQLSPLVGHSLTDVIIAAAELGQLDLARAKLHFMDEHARQDTDVLELFAPESEAAIAMAQDKPAQAVTLLQPAAVYGSGESSVPAMLSQAYLAAHQPDLAQRDFRQIIDRPYAGGISPNIALAHLGLARALAMGKNGDASRQEYETLFALWKDADPNLPLMKQAHKEYAILSAIMIHPH
jgi:eukaryotic-like serine/threonine-protein kinase